MRRHRVDTTQREIVAALRAIGAIAHPITSAGGTVEGLPDLLVGYRGQTYLLEVKSPRGVVSASQVEWAQRWRGGPLLLNVRTVDDALEAIGATRARG